MNIPRAQFVKTFVFALVGVRTGASVLLASSPSASAASNAAAAAALGRGPMSLEDATADLFRPHVNTAFTVRAAAGSESRLVLARVTERPLTANVEQFSLTLLGSADTPLADGIHNFSHPVLGCLVFFINRVGTVDRRPAVYQACFGRFLSDRPGAGATATATGR